MNFPKKNRCAVWNGDFFYSTNPGGFVGDFTAVSHSFTKLLTVDAQKKQTAREEPPVRLVAIQP